MYKNRVEYKLTLEKGVPESDQLFRKVVLLRANIVVDFNLLSDQNQIQKGDFW